MQKDDKQTKYCEYELEITKEELTYIKIEVCRYCIKTGKKLTSIPFNEVKKLISIHGEERATIVINKLQQAIAIEWILTDSEGLKNLAIYQPVEYLIYALSALLIKPKPDNTIELLNDFNLKIKINKYLKTLPIEQITNIAELVRRILASNRPVALQEMLNNITLKSVCENQESLLKFQLTLQECLKLITFGYYDDTLVNARERQKKALFENQKQLTALTELEKEIGISLNNFQIVINKESGLTKLVKQTKKSKIVTKLKEITLKSYYKQKDKDTISLDSFKSNSFAGIKFESKG